MKSSLKVLAVVACLLAPVASNAATYTCTERTNAPGGSSRTLTIDYRDATETARVTLGDLQLSGLVQTNVDGRYMRLTAPNGRVFVLSIRRRTGRVMFAAEASVDGEKSRPEFSGVCIKN